MTDQLLGMAASDLVLGAVLLLLGLRAGRRALPPHPLLGIAIPSTTSNDEAWYAGHEAAAAPLVQGGALGVLGSLGAVATVTAWAPWVALGVFVGVLGHVFGAVVVCDRAARPHRPRPGWGADADLDG